MKKPGEYAIVPHLWFDRQAREAAEFYGTLFENSRFLSSTVLRDTPSGDAESVRFELAGQPFEAISAGPDFKLNPSISLMVSFPPGGAGGAWNALSEAESRDGGASTFSVGTAGSKTVRFSLAADACGRGGRPRSASPPCCCSRGVAAGRRRRSSSLPRCSRIGSICLPVSGGRRLCLCAKVNYAGIRLAGSASPRWTTATARTSALTMRFSLIVYCRTGGEIDFTGTGCPRARAECGWSRTNRVSWQIVRVILGELIEAATKNRRARGEAFLR